MSETLEACLQQAADLIAANRACNWSLGDLLCDAVRQFGRGCVGKFAEVCGCSRARILQLMRVADAFPVDARLPDVGWSVYRACQQVAARQGKGAREVLEEVLAEEPHPSAATVERMFRAKQRVTRRWRCDWCSSVILVDSDEGVDVRLLCPVCLADGQERQLWPRVEEKSREAPALAEALGAQTKKGE